MSRYIDTRPLAKLLAVISLLVGAGILLAWFLGSPGARTALSGLMKTNTAFAVTLASGSLLLLNQRRSLRFANALAWIVLGLAVATLIQYLFDVRLGIDELLIRDIPMSEMPAYPNRMSPIAAFNFVLLAIALLNLDAKPWRQEWYPFQFFAFWATAISGVTVIGYLYGVSQFYQVGPFIRISWVTALCMILLGFGILFTHPDRGVMRTLTVHRPGGVAARRLLLASVVLPLIVGWFRMEGQRLGLYEAAQGSSLSVITYIFLFSFLIYQSARTLNRLDVERESAEENLRKATESRAHQLQKLAQASVTVVSKLTLEEALQVTAECAREVIRAHRAIAFLRPDRDRPKEMQAVSDSGKTSSRGGSGKTLAVALVSRDHRNIGYIELSEPESGSFTDEDKLILIQLAQIASSVVENILLFAREQEAVRSRDEFLSIASHELKTPLTSLQLQTQTLRRKIDRGDREALSPERIGKVIQINDRQVERLTRLIDEMLDISRINSGKLELKLEECDLSAIVQEVAERVHPQFEAAGCELKLDLAPSVLGTWDRFRIEQVLLNIFTNALKYGGGRPVDASLRREGRWAILRVRDHGIGIAPENQERIFNRFERATSDSEISGLGLGLYIVRQILERHGGRIRVESELGKGSVFEIALPANPLH